MFIDIKNKKLSEGINKTDPSRNIDIIFDKEEKYFLCYSYPNIDYITRVYPDKNKFRIEHKLPVEYEYRYNLLRWFDTQGKDLFKEEYLQLKL